MELVIFIGLQGCGKSAFYKERFFRTHVRINLDMLRTRHRERMIFEVCLRAGQPMVIDNTNPAPADRARYIPAARAAGFRVAGYWFESTIEECRARNEQREGKAAVPLAALRATAARLRPPSPDEGFDELWDVRIAFGGGFTVARGF